MGNGHREQAVQNMQFVVKSWAHVTFEHRLVTNRALMFFKASCIARQPLLYAPAAKGDATSEPNA